MKSLRRLLLTILLLTGRQVFAQEAAFNPLKKVDDGLYFLYYDSSSAKSTVVEFRDFLVLVEVPVRDEGADAVRLVDHRAGDERALTSLAHYFPGKPVRYVVHSHWHPHSLSAIAPFLTRGITLVTTASTFDKLKPAIDPAVLAQYGKHVQLVTGDSLVLRDRRQRLVVHRVEQKNYPATATAEYLYCYLPRYNLLACGCMFTRWGGAPVAGKEVLTGRAEDLHRFLADRKLAPRALIRVSKEKTEPDDMQPIAHLTDVAKNGIRASELAQRYLALDASQLTAQREALVAATLRDHIPPSILNDCVYKALGRRELEKALALAQLQALVAPSDLNAWDTLGEAYYFLGQTELARHYAQEVKRLSPTTTSGGEAVWAKDLADHQLKWSAVK